MTVPTVRAATPQDGPAIAAVQLDTWRATYGAWIPDVVAGLDPDRTADNWARAAVRPGQRVAVAADATGVLGYAWSGPAEEDPALGELHALYVRPAAQGCGAGRLLVADALVWLAAAGYPSCVVWALERHTPALRFYERLGFVPDGGPTRLWRGLTELRHTRPTGPWPRRSDTAGGYPNGVEAGRGSW
ncbi:GNAT family N-acetyltransferase [Longispora sp. NPDC051575]|uniref:GNAT family N-acetyltransferase n=1 Tax=Longispora sp. NPDC051575 TaxID=3154943 RepID=UPI003438531C